MISKELSLIGGSSFAQAREENRRPSGLVTECYSLALCVLTGVFIFIKIQLDVYPVLFIIDKLC